MFSNFINTAKRVVDIELEGIRGLLSNLDQSFELTVNTILQSKGRVIICGMGKSGLIGKKISASLASTGTPSFFMHPGEAFHGDLGMVTPDDVFIAISNSGETDEILKILPFLNDNGNFLVAMTGNSSSTLAKAASSVLNISVDREACPHQLAPTASTTATLVMGDILTVVLMEERSFSPENFARFHPGGALGRKLLSKVADEMVALPPTALELESPFIEVVSAISSGELGFVIVQGSECYDFSVITDGDIRRAMEEFKQDVFNLKAQDIASQVPLTITTQASTKYAYDLMEASRVNFLLALEGKELVGVLKK